MGQHSMCLRILEENSDISFNLACSMRWYRVGMQVKRARCQGAIWDPHAILAALSGPNPKAPGFAGGILTHAIFPTRVGSGSMIVSGVRISTR